MENNVLIVNEEDIRNKIYTIRGQKVMLDSDLAEIYGYTTMRLNEQVKRNKSKFEDEDFMFQLTLEEYRNLISQKAISSWGGKRKPPYAFTEQGIYMLMTVLKGELAIKQSKALIRIFKAMKDYIVNNNYLTYSDFAKLSIQTNENTKRIDLLEEAISNFKEKNSHIFFNGQVYDAYSLLIDIFNKSKKEIIINDNYIDINILDILSKTKKKIILVTNKYNNIDYKKYKNQYSNIELIISNDFHDRFIIIDKSILYHCGASFKDLGKKCFAISKLEDKEYLDSLLNKLEK